MTAESPPPPLQQPRRTWRQWSKQTRVRIGFVLMLIVAISVFTLWWPRRGIMAVVRVGDFPIDSQSEVRAAELLSWMPAGVANAVRPMLEDRASWLSTDGQITHVDMTGSKVNGVGFANLRRFPRLAIVSIRATQVDGAIEDLSRIRTLKAVWVEASDSAADLSELKRIPNLTTVSVHNPSKIGCHLNGLCGATQLKTISLHNAVDPGPHLEEIAQLPLLDRLTLRKCLIHNDDFRHMGSLTGLKTLDVSGRRPIDATGLKHIAQIKSLLRLTLNPCSATDDELKALAELSNLQDLHIRGPNLTQAGIERLKQDLPNCVINSQ